MAERVKKEKKKRLYQTKEIVKLKLGDISPTLFNTF